MRATAAKMKYVGVYHHVIYESLCTNTHYACQTVSLWCSQCYAYGQTELWRQRNTSNTHPYDGNHAIPTPYKNLLPLTLIFTSIFTFFQIYVYIPGCPVSIIEIWKIQILYISLGSRHTGIYILSVVNVNRLSHVGNMGMLWVWWITDGVQDKLYRCKWPCSLARKVIYILCTHVFQTIKYIWRSLQLKERSSNYDKCIQAWENYVTR